MWDSGDWVEILWDGGITSAVYADHRDGGRVLVDIPDEGHTLMTKSEFGRCVFRGGMQSSKTEPLQATLDRMIDDRTVDDTTDTSAAHA